ncbi:PREDICTED: interleukin-10 receptor subunit alpha [Gavialis gangeticus]|uniref:interleukin-10 receptor subunit alpha n=1 Tax=Gavialis gangeticus TaxID=94835 RepID=UPI00092E379F|nr:PREDICTED: interleukin-10 receptor subunit alpha [Gavialis gangeticus]
MALGCAALTLALLLPLCPWAHGAQLLLGAASSGRRPPCPAPGKERAARSRENFPGSPLAFPRHRISKGHCSPPPEGNFPISQSRQPCPGLAWGASLPSPRGLLLPAAQQLAAPTRVRFVAQTLQHVLHWEPAEDAPHDTLYNVEYRLYGPGSWMPAPKCRVISELSCDLTNETMEPTKRYYAQVRAVSGNCTSTWTRTNAFSPREATLRLAGVHLSVTGNNIHVSVQLPLPVGNVTVSFAELYKHSRQYLVLVNRTSDHEQVRYVHTSETIVISDLSWGEQYCVRLQPHIISRPNPGIWTEEKCVSIPIKDEKMELISTIVGIVLFILAALVLLGMLFICMYIRRPMRTPGVLKSLIKQSTLWAEQEHFSGGGTDVSSVWSLSMCPKDTAQRAHLDSGSELALPVLDEDCTVHGDQECLLEGCALPADDRSCSSTDSGICLQASSSDLSQPPGSESQGYQRQLPQGDDSGISLAKRPPSQKDYELVEEGDVPRPGALGRAPAAGAEEGEHVPFRGYLQQSKGQVEARLILDSAGPAWSAGKVEGTLDVGSEPVTAKGYLKQASPELPHSSSSVAIALRDQALAQQLAPLGLLNRFDSGAWDLPSSGVPAPSPVMKLFPDLPKAPFHLSIFDTGQLGTLPPISSLNSGEWLSLDIELLSLLDAECKDSRL